MVTQCYKYLEIKFDNIKYSKKVYQKQNKNKIYKLHKPQIQKYGIYGPFYVYLY